MFHSNYCGVNTGFGLFMRELLLHLYKTGKYDLHLYSSGVTWDTPDFQRWPWKCYGALPNDKNELDRLNRDPHALRMASYGAYNIDRVVRDVKPDVYVGVEDFWGLSYALDKPWWNKIGCVLHWTADSLPLLPEAVEKAHRIKHHFVWADFAVKEFHRLAAEAEAQVQRQKAEFFARKWQSREQFQAEKEGFDRWENEARERIAGFRGVKLLRGTVNTDCYHRIPDRERLEIRRRFGITDDTFLVGTLSRNQLRKLFPNLMEGFSMFRRQNPEVKSKLLMYCSWAEGWDIKRLMDEFGVHPDDVLACYRCKETGMWFIRPYGGEDIDNPKTGHKRSMVTVNITHGLSYQDLNRIYNIMDVFCLPITSGGMERALVEAKTCGLVTLVNPYSCGEDLCVPEAESLHLDFSKYKEIGTNFTKASAYPASIAKRLRQTHAMGAEERKRLGDKARAWVLGNFSIEVVGGEYEKLLDSFPETNYDFDSPSKMDLKNPNAIIPDISDNVKWVQSLYADILRCPGVQEADPGLQSWLERLKCGVLRSQVSDYFREVARKDNATIGDRKETGLKDLLDDNGRKRFLVVMKESTGDNIYLTCLLGSLAKTYPDHDVYVACDPQYAEIYDGNPNVHKVIPYMPQMESELEMTGYGKVKGLFDAYCMPAAACQRHLNYVSRDKTALELAA